MGKYNREVNTRKHRKYSKTKKGKEAVRRAIRKYELSHPDRRKAWTEAQKINNSGKSCIVCGELKTHRHHPDISRPLEVVFLCPLHHKQAHML